MSRGVKKAERLKEIERLLTQHRRGFTAPELAKRFGVNRTTIWRDIEALAITNPQYYEVVGIGLTKPREDSLFGNILNLIKYKERPASEIHLLGIGSDHGVVDATTSYLVGLWTNPKDNKDVELVICEEFY